jgi:hypothetical protein
MNCPFCKEPMTYGVQREVLCKMKVVDGKSYARRITYDQLGWECRMKEDECDVIFDDKNTGTNKANYEKACNDLAASFPKKTDE